MKERRGSGKNPTHSRLRRVAGAGLVLSCLFCSQVIPVRVPAEGAGIPDLPIRQEPQTALPASISDLPGTEGLQVRAESNMARLHLDPTTLLIAIEEKRSGTVWFSSPPTREDDALAEGSVLMEMGSHLVVTYVDEQKNASSVNSMIGSVKRETFSITSLPDGFEILFDFSREKERFRIPVQYRLREDRLDVEIRYDRIEEYGEVLIAEIRLLPYLGSGRSDQEGFLLIPDGSGALVRFGDRKPWAIPYDEAVYGRDPTLTNIRQAVSAETIHLPIFGISNTGGSLLAIISQGSPMASIRCIPAGYNSEYASVSSSHVFRQRDVSVIADREWNSREIGVISPQSVSVNPVVQYHVLPGSDAPISDLANRCREWLVETFPNPGRSVPGSLPVVFEAFGAAKKETSILGVIVRQPVVGTSFQDAADMLDSLEEAGIPKPTLVLQGFLRGGYRDRIPAGIHWEPDLGGRTGSRRLLEVADRTGAGIVLAMDLVHVYRPSFGWWPFLASCRAVNREFAWRYDFSLSNGSRILDGTRWFLARPERSASTLAKILGNNSPFPVDGLLLSQIGRELYSNHDRQHSATRQDTAEQFTRMGEMAREETGMTVVEGGNAYMLGTADLILDAPLSDSRYDLATESVPFLPIVLHGLVDLTGPPLNQVPDQTHSLLQHAAVGAGLLVQVTGQPSEIFFETDLEFLYNSFYKQWIDRIATAQSWLSTLHDGLSDQLILEYRQLQELSITTFESGTRIVVNYGKEPIQFEGDWIPSQSAIRLNG